MNITTAAVPNADVAIYRYGERGRQWVDGVHSADPLADAVVADFAGLGRGAGMAMFRGALADGIDSVPHAPESLRALFDQVDHEPAWLDHDRLDRAGGHLVRHMTSYGVVLAAASLTAGAMNATAGMPLVMTGRYTSQAAARSLEVGSWLEEILKPGGLRRDGAGFATTLRLRMIHAFVRRHLLDSGDWDSEAWGTPIPQSFMAFTIAEFAHVALAAMYKLGVRYTADELDDIYHFWRYVGLLGGRRRHEFAVRLVNGLVRAFVGDEAAAKLGIPDTALKHLPAVVGPAMGGVNRLLAAVPGITALRTKRALGNHSRVIAEQRERYGVTHDRADTAPTQGKAHPAAV